MRTLALAAALSLTASIAHADAPGLDLRPEATPAATEGANDLRITGFSLAAAGLATTIVGGAMMGYTMRGGGGSYSTVTLAGEVGATMSGTTTFAVGLGLGLVGQRELGAPMPRAKARKLRTAGIVLTALGGVLAAGAIASTIELGTACVGDDDGTCTGLSLLFATGLGSVSSAFLGAGVPLIVIGQHEGKPPVITIDSMRPRSMSNGGGFGIGGRF